MSHARPTQRWNGNDPLTAGGSHYGQTPAQSGLMAGRGLFRRPTTAPRRRRRHPWRLAARWLLRGLLITALPLALAGWLLTSPRFALAEISVTPTTRVPVAWVDGSLAPLTGSNLISLPLARVHRQLAAHPWVAGVSIHKELPATLRVEVEERQPAALVTYGERFWYADADGALIAPLAAGEEPDGLLVVRGYDATPAEEADAEAGGKTGARTTRAAPPLPRLDYVPRALELVDELVSRQPLWASGLIALEALNDEDFVIETTALPFDLRVRAGSVTMRGDRLRELLPRIEERFGAGGLAMVDLRFSRRIVLQSDEPSDPSQRGRTSDSIKVR